MPVFPLGVAWIMKMGKGMDIQECHRILKVVQGAEWTEIKKSFYRLAKEYHPDRNAGNRASEEKFKEISRAYETLERWTQSHQFSYRVYSHAAATKDHVVPFEEGLRPFDFLPERIHKYLNRWTQWMWRWLQSYEEKWLELNVEKVVTIDPVTASKGGTIKIKNTAGSFHVEVPRKTPSETILRVPGKGEKGLFHRVPGDLLLKIQVDPGRQRLPGVSEYFYQVKVIQDQSQKVRTLYTQEGPILYRLPKKIKAGQSFVLKSKSHPRTGKVSHHILVIDLI
jgi:DnaJ-class molecular chaperone